MSHYTMYRCDGCGFEDTDPSFLMFESADGGRDWCADCEGYASLDQSPSDQPTTGADHA